MRPNPLYRLVLPCLLAFACESAEPSSNPDPADTVTPEDATGAPEVLGDAREDAPGGCTASAECASGEICSGGACGACQADVQCRAEYGEHATCVEGLCQQPDCLPGETGCTCSDGACDDGVCVDDTCVPCEMGITGCECYPNSTCNDGTCVDGLCTDCPQGQTGCACAIDGTCTDGVCTDGLCAECTAGTDGCPCYTDGTCQAGLQCTDGACAPCAAGLGGCPCDEGACEAGTVCAADVCVPDTCEAGASGCPCDDGACASDGDICLDGLCAVCTSEIAGCPCDEGACGTGFVCGEADLCRAPLSCEETCALHQECEQQDGADPECLESCEEGWAWNAGEEVCESTATPNCEAGAPGSIAAQCAATNKQCVEGDDSAICEGCLGGFIDEGAGGCVAVQTCDDLGCDAAGKACTEATGTSHAACGDCKSFYVPDEASPGDCRVVKSCAQVGCDAAGQECIAATASGDASCGGCKDYYADDGSGGCTPVQTCAELDCAGLNKVCVDATPSANATCGGCADFYVTDESDATACRPVITCGEAGCAAANQECTAATATADATCGGCLEGYEVDGEVCVVIPINCGDGTYNSILADCTALNQQCVAPTGEDAYCGDCLDGYALGDGGSCAKTTTCTELGCAGLLRACAGATPFEECGECLDGAIENPGDPEECMAPATCAEIECEEDEFCVDGEETSYCLASDCDDGFAYSEYFGQCEACTVNCGDDEGETGRIWPLTLEDSSICICESEEGYYWEEATRNTKLCDADGDGWLRSEARAKLESADPTISANARCDVLTIDRFVLQNELGQRLELHICDDGDEPLVREDLGPCTFPYWLPLYESTRNDDQTELAGDSDATTVTTGSMGRKLRASEVNPLTRACTRAGDYNHNGVTDISEWQDMVVSGADFEDRIYNRVSYYLELHRAWYEAGTESTDLGVYVIAERSRCDDGFPVVYGGTSSDYWRECTRSRDTGYDPGDASPEFGLDYAEWSCDVTSGGCPVPPPPTDTVAAADVPVHGLCSVALPPQDDECDDPSAGGWLCVDGGVWRGMSHHSQFRCVIVNDSTSTTEPHLPASEFYDGSYQLTRCGVTCPDGDADCSEDCTVDGCATSSVSPGEDEVQPSTPELTCVTDDSPATGDVGFALALFDGDSLTYERGCINEWVPETLTTGDTGADNAVVAAWRSLCPGFTSQPGAVAGQADPQAFGALQCGCGSNYGEIGCTLGCPGGDLLLSDGYESIPRSGVWMCASISPTHDTALDADHGLALVGTDASGSVWAVAGEVSTKFTDGTALCQSGSTCDTLGLDATTYGTDAVCGSAGDCLEGATFTDAEAACAALGMRLCTLDELEADEARGTGCDFDQTLVWSQTACEGGYYQAAGSTELAGDNPTACADATTGTANVRCCADAACTGYEIR